MRVCMERRVHATERGGLGDSEQIGSLKEVDVSNPKVGSSSVRENKKSESEICVNKRERRHKRNTYTQMSERYL